MKDPKFDPTLEYTDCDKDCEGTCYLCGKQICLNDDEVEDHICKECQNES